MNKFNTEQLNSLSRIIAEEIAKVSNDLNIKVELEEITSQPYITRENGRVYQVNLERVAQPGFRAWFSIHPSENKDNEDIEVYPHYSTQTIILGTDQVKISDNEYYINRLRSFIGKIQSVQYYLSSISSCARDEYKFGHATWIIDTKKFFSLVCKHL